MLSLRFKPNKKKMVLEVSITNLNKIKKRRNRNRMKRLGVSLGRTTKRTQKIISKNKRNGQVHSKQRKNLLTPKTRKMSQIVLN
jgi:hypothetical protein